MWALIKDNEIDHIIAHPKSMVIDDIRHPRAIFTVWSDADLKAIGIVPVTTSGSHLDARFYIEKNEVFALAEDGNSVIRTIGEKATDKKLTDTDYVDENGDPIINGEPQVEDETPINRDYESASNETLGLRLQILTVLESILSIIFGK